MKIPVICTTLLIEKSPQALPLGAACIATAIKHSPLTENHTRVGLKTFSLEDKEIEKIRKDENKIAEFIAAKLYKDAEKKSDSTSTIEHETVSSGTPFVFCFSCFVWNITILEKAAIILRKKGCICIAGGPEITAHPEFYKGFDYTVSGEGEESLPKLISQIISQKGWADDDGDSGRKSLNMSINIDFLQGKSPSNVIISSSPELSKLHSPYLDEILNPSEYEGALWELARGCPFRCSYCYESKGQKKVRYFPMERIKAELDLFAAKKVPQVFVLDPTYNVDKKRAVELLRLISKKTPDTFYYFEARAEFIDRELAHEFTRIPCALQIGLQSANEQTLKLVNRPFDKKKFLKGISILNEEGVTFGLDLIFGLPGETFGSFRDGIDFAISVYPNNLEIFCLSVLPGTDLFDRADSLGLTYEKNPPYHVIKTKDFSPEDIERAQKLSKACTCFYNSGRAVPWFNSICRVLKFKPSKLFELFYQNYSTECEKLCSDCGNENHENIQKIQLEFLHSQFASKNLMRYYAAAEDIVKFYGAISRTTDTRKSEILTLNYDADYVASDYASDIKYFTENLHPKKCRIQTFVDKNGNVDFKKVK